MQSKKDKTKTNKGLFQLKAYIDGELNNSTILNIDYAPFKMSHVIYI